jgi:hypothetical protein
MPKITKVWPLPADAPRYPEPSVLIYVDDERCTVIRQRVWKGMALAVGSEISCGELQERQALHWKLQYQAAGAWDKEKTRLLAVTRTIEQLDPRVTTIATGFGAHTTALIPYHPAEAGSPDIEVRLRNTGEVVLLVEVTGTEQMRGTSFWVRPDKLDYANAHPERDIWIAFHYAQPTELLMIYKPSPGTSHEIREHTIRYSVERYVELDGDAPGMVSIATFGTYLRAKTDSVAS